MDVVSHVCPRARYIDGPSFPSLPRSIRRIPDARFQSILDGGGGAQSVICLWVKEAACGQEECHISGGRRRRWWEGSLARGMTDSRVYGDDSDLEASHFF